MSNTPWSPKLKMWLMEAYKEIGVDKHDINNNDIDYITYPKRFTDNINNTSPKMYDYVFIGGLNTCEDTYTNRKWILPFIDKNFNDRSYLQFTDPDTKMQHVPKGSYDHTFEHEGFVPKNVPECHRNWFDKHYFDILSRSKFGLCPAGDEMWSMRFFECMMCKCIPIVNSVEETWRSAAESRLGYKFYLSTDQEIVYRKDWVEYNYNMFQIKHTLMFHQTGDS